MQCRPAQPGEIRSAVGWILSQHGRPAGHEQVLDFLRFAMHRRINLNDIWVVQASGRIIWAALPVVSPGRTLLLCAPTYPSDQTQLRAASELVPAICHHWAGRGVHLAQVLIDPSDAASHDLYCGCAFDAMAELIYLQSPGRSTNEQSAELRGFSWHCYRPELHDLFARTIALSYEGSLDCPALNGRRDIEDVVAGHQSAGDFDPANWLLLCDSDLPDPHSALRTLHSVLGVLLLAQARHTDVLELVYLGLTPHARGRGLADLLLSRALHAVQERGCATLSLAVDSRNLPALKLYYRHGMKQICTKLAMLQDLRITPVHPALNA